MDEEKGRKGDLLQNLFFRFINDLVNGFKELSLHTAKRNEFRKYMQETCDMYRKTRLAGVLRDWFGQIQPGTLGHMRQNINTTQYYSLDAFHSLRIDKPSHCIMPVFTTENVAGDNLTDTFELVLKANVGGETARFSCEYNAASLKKDKVEELILNYKKLFKIIIERMS